MTKERPGIVPVFRKLFFDKEKDELSGKTKKYGSDTEIRICNNW